MSLKISTDKLLYAFALLISITLSSCAHTPSFDPEGSRTETVKITPEPKSEMDQTREQISKLQDKIQDLETRLGALNDKINLENGVQGSSASSSAADKKLPTEAVEAPPAHAKVIPVRVGAKKITAKKAASETFTSNETIDRFREAKILYDSKKYSDAMLEFSEFVKNDPDHALSPAAQYYLGMSYLNQKEYKLAEEEFSRGLLSYAHSSYIPDTLLALAEVSEKLKKPTKVAYFKEKILSNFPNSPQAKALSLNSPFTSGENSDTKEPVKEMSEGEASVVEAPKPPTAPAPVKAEPSIEGDHQ